MQGMSERQYAAHVGLSRGAIQMILSGETPSSSRYSSASKPVFPAPRTTKASKMEASVPSAAAAAAASR